MSRLDNARITCEDDLPLFEGDELILPLGIVIGEDQTPSITCYPAFRDVAEEIAALPSDILTKKETLAELLSRCLPRLSALGYQAEWHITTVYSLDRREDVKKECLRADTEPLLPDHPYQNLTDCEPDPLGEGLLCFGTVCDGKILSAASENPHEEGETIVDVGVETAEGYEKNGYAAANVAALAYYLLDPGIRVTYLAEDDNPASHRVAEKVGFRPTGKELRLVGYKE